MKKILILYTVILFTFKAHAQQGEVSMTASIAGAVPTGQLKDLADKTSLRGADVVVLYGLNDHLSVGLNVAFQDFYQKYPRAVYKLEDGSDISAVLSNSVQTIPILATVKYSFVPAARVRPYASAGAGAAAVMYRQFVGEYPNEFDKISFAVKPGAGVFIPFRKKGEAGLNLGVHYTYIPYKQDDISNLSYIGFTIGIGFPMRN